MKNITKLGLTALAGSLVASSAFAGAMSVSGSAKITHASADETEVQGNSFSNSKGLSFSGSGELDNGYTVSTTYSMTNSAFSSSQVTIDMGDQGTVGLWNYQSRYFSSSQIIILNRFGNDLRIPH